MDRSGTSGGQDAGLMCGPVWYKRREGRWFNVWSGLVQAEGRTLALMRAREDGLCLFPKRTNTKRVLDSINFKGAHNS